MEDMPLDDMSRDPDGSGADGAPAKAAASGRSGRRPAADGTSTGAGAAEPGPAEIKPADAKAADAKPADAKPAKGRTSASETTKRRSGKRATAGVGEPVAPASTGTPTAGATSDVPPSAPGSTPGPAAPTTAPVADAAADEIPAAETSDAETSDAETHHPLAAWEARAARGLAFLRRRLTGEYEVDEFGFDPDLNDTVMMGVLRPFYEKYFRVEVSGIENVPSEGGALIVANHSGTVPVDALMVQVALLDHHPAHRHLRMLAADLVFTLPFVGELSRKMGHTLACNPDAERLLSSGEVVGVWPEGFKGVGKPFSQRYRLQRFGRGGFVSAALRTGVPIVPVSIVGAEEIYPKIGDIKPLARLLGLPYFPVTPTFPLLGPLGLVPLPTKWHIAFGDPIATDKYDPGAADDPMLVFDLTDQIRETIQDTLYRLLLQRRSVFF